MAYSQEIINQIIERKDNKEGGRDVAEYLLGKRSKKSTVNNIYNRFLKGEIKYTGDKVLTTNPDEECVDKNTVEKDITDTELNTLCEHPDFSVSNLAKRLRAAQRTNNQLRKIQREVFDGEYVTPLDMKQVIKSALLDNKQHLDVKIQQPTETTPKTVEILFSDWQVSKISEGWNTEIALKTLKYYGEEVLKIVNDVKPERIVFASLGDSCEQATKHGMQSAYSTDASDAEQIAHAIRGIWWGVLKPLVETGIPMDVVAIAGNHGSDCRSGMDMYKPGRYNFEWVIFNALEDLVNTVRAHHVKFDIPEGIFTTYEIYGQLTLAEHGYKVAPTESAMIKHRDKRANNLQKYIDRAVFGDSHHLVNIDNGRFVVNGAFFGIAFTGIEYSGISGYHAVPGQFVMIHEPVTGKGQNTVVDTKFIQVAKGY